MSSLVSRQSRVQQDRFFSAFFLWVILVSPVANAHGQLADTVEKITPSIVGIGSFDPLGAPKAQLKATGFVVEDGKYVVTNFHVVDGVEVSDRTKLVVFAGSGNEQEVFLAKVVGEDRQNDLVVLSYESPSKRRLPALRLIDGDGMRRIGESIAFTGYPIGAVLGFYAVTHSGIISSITPIVIPADRASQLTSKSLRRLRNPYFVYQLDATAYPGNSGSPVYLPDTGEVVGVVNKVFIKETKESVLEKPSGITYAIPVNALKALLDSL